MTWLVATLAVFAIYRIARMIAEEDGPAFVFKRLRDHFTDDKSWIAVGLRCFYCVSIWAALPIAILLVVAGGWDEWLWPVWWLGLAGGAAKVYEFWNRK